MAEKEYNYNITQTFYAKWILPFVLLLIGTLLILFFYPGTKFLSGKDAESKEIKSFYKISMTIDNEKQDRYVEVKSKDIYYVIKSGSYEYYLNTNTKYDKHVPLYSPIRKNLAYMGIAGGIGLSTVGLFMLFINTFNKITKISPKKKKQLENESLDEEDDE